LPKSYTLEVPANLDLKEDFAEYHAEYSLKDGVFTTDRRLVSFVSEVPVAAYEKYKAFRKKIDDDRDLMIQLSSVTAPPSGAAAGALPSLAEAMNQLRQAVWALPTTSDRVAAQYENDARDGIMRNDIDGAIASLQSAVDKDPKFARAWLLLGGMLSARFRQDAALDAYHSAVKADPRQAISYKVLGFALMAARKFDEAASVWQELSKIAPEDKDAEPNLAQALLALKRYPEAAAAAESAVKSAPDKVLYHMLLGQAYLGTGNKEKAGAAFEQAIKLDSSPAVLNDVAYELAERNVDLPAAEQYALNAIRQEEEASSKLQLSDLSSSDLSHTQKLAMFWDTLGWVYFRLNDLVRAEKFLRAAWQLSQYPVIGRHLAKVYEKQGKKTAALHLYQLAYAATPIRVAYRGGSAGPARDAGWDDDLKRLGAKPEAMAQSDLNKMRTFALPRIVSGNASADYLVLFGPGGKVEAKFISGSDSLKAAEKAVVRVSYGFSFPDDGPTRIARKALVGCDPYTGCSIVFMTQTATPPTPPLLAAAP
jgi:tetratricopeptide (TPR) repeat protein